MYLFGKYTTMHTLSYTSARATLAKTMQQVCDDHSPIVITRSKAEPVVIMSLSDFEAMRETSYLIQSPANAARLAEAIEEVEHMINKSKKKK